MIKHIVTQFVCCLFIRDYLGAKKWLKTFQARAATLMVLQSIEGLAPLSADPLMALQGHLGLLYMELWQHCS